MCQASKGEFLLFHFHFGFRAVAYGILWLPVSLCGSFPFLIYKGSVSVCNQKNFGVNFLTVTVNVLLDPVGGWDS